MKIFTYLRTFWKFFAHSQAKVEELYVRQPYWMPMVENNLPSIAKDLGIETLQPENWPRNEEEAKALYLKWCQKTDVPATKIANDSKVSALNETLSGMAESLGLYDFGGKNFVVPSPMEMDFNGNKHETYVISFEK